MLPPAAFCSQMPWLQAADSCCAFSKAMSWATHDCPSDGETRCDLWYRMRSLMPEALCSSAGEEDSTTDWTRGRFLNGLMPNGLSGGLAGRGIGRRTQPSWKNSMDGSILFRPGETVRMASIDLAWSADPKLDVPGLR